jgi:uncharacterized Zn finger protein
LLAGKFPQALKDSFSKKAPDSFRARDIHLTGCPDWASMCKHAAALYGVGARLDEDRRYFYAAWHQY